MNKIFLNIVTIGISITSCSELTEGQSETSPNVESNTFTISDVKTFDFTSQDSQLYSSTTHSSSIFYGNLNLSSSIALISSKVATSSNNIILKSSISHIFSSKQPNSFSIQLSSSSLPSSSSNSYSSEELLSSFLLNSSSGNESCNGLNQWDSISWKDSGNGGFYLDENHESAWSCDGTASCAWEPGNPRSSWVKAFDC